jgi:hypothetical protein
MLAAPMFRQHQPLGCRRDWDLYSWFPEYIRIARVQSWVRSGP